MNNPKWFVIEKGDGWEVSFGSSNSEDGCVFVGPNAKEYAYLVANLGNENVFDRLKTELAIGKKDWEFVSKRLEEIYLEIKAMK